MSMNVKRICAYAVAAFLILAVAFRLIAGEGFEYGTVTSRMIQEKAVTAEILTDTVLEQTFVSECDRITGITLLGTNYGKTVDDELRLAVLNGSGQTVASAVLNTAGLPDSSQWSIPVEDSTDGHRGETLTLQVTSAAGSTGNAVSLFYGDTVSAGKYELDIPTETTRQAGCACLSAERTGIRWPGITGTRWLPCWPCCCCSAGG